MPTKAKPKVKAVAKLPKSVAKSYCPPVTNVVTTQITPDEPAFVPVDGKLLAKCPLDHQSQLKQTLTHRTTAVVDCGFSMQLPTGWKVEAHITPEKAARGLALSTPNVIDANGRVKVSVINVGKEVCVIRQLDHIADLVISPKYEFDWDVQQKEIA